MNYRCLEDNRKISNDAVEHMDTTTMMQRTVLYIFPAKAAPPLAALAPALTWKPRSGGDSA